MRTFVTVLMAAVLFLGASVFVLAGYEAGGPAATQPPSVIMQFKVMFWAIAGGATVMGGLLLYLLGEEKGRQR